MNHIAIKTPMLPESVSDATVVTWHKQTGEHVIQDENLVDLETDKVVLEVPAPQSGVLTEIFQPEGSIVTADTLLAHIEPGETPTLTNIEIPKIQEEPAKPQVKTKKIPERSHASPSVRQQLRANDLQETDVIPSGEKGHILKQDVDQHVAEKPTSAAMPAPDFDTSSEREERRVPMTRLRARIADRLLAAQQNAAILTTFNEVDMQAVIDIRNRYKTNFLDAHHVKLGFMSFFIQACCEALKKFPEVNASIDDSDIVYHGYYDVGVAVSSERGLVVPVIRNADHLSMAEIEQTIVDFGSRAREGKLTMDDLTGGTFTLSNGGVFGSLMSTPILNPPQTGILGLHKIDQRPVAINGEVVIRPMMYLALSYDHRLVDGQAAVRFLVMIKELIEDPSRLLLRL
jgi:2-oxoglutarate dehydrogenase E2 component (dihydrolipoamide succinyltransferase)